MKAAAFDYIAARDLDEAIAALSSRSSAKLIAGGQSLGPMLNLRLARPDLLVDISRVDELRRIDTSGDSVLIGGATTHSQIEDEAGGILKTVAAGIAYRSVRNRGTIGGSMAHADPAADWPLALAAMGASIRVRGPAGGRTVAAADFMTAAFTTVLEDTEIVETIEVPRPSAAARWGYYKFCRKTGEFPEASAALLLDPERRIANVFIGALSGPPRRCEGLARQLARCVALSPATFRDAVAATVNLDRVALRMQAAVLTRAVAQAIGP